MARIKTLPTDRDTQTAMTIARDALERRGYPWQPQADGTALAHEKGRPIKHRATAWRVLIAVRPYADRLELPRMTSGIIGLAFNAAPTMMIWADAEYRSAVNDIDRALNPQ